MTVWYKAARNMGWSSRVVIAVMALAAVLVAFVPVALFAGVILMLLGHVVGGLALFGASILAAGAAVVVAGLSGIRHLRKLLNRKLLNRQDFRVVQLGRGEYHFD
ncbi:MAG TPA: hypothetical protein VF070_08240 [Streptosporangiaceae bacterium]